MLIDLQKSASTDYCSPISEVLGAYVHSFALDNQANRLYVFVDSVLDRRSFGILHDMTIKLAGTHYEVLGLEVVDLQTQSKDVSNRFGKDFNLLLLTFGPVR